MSLYFTYQRSQTRREAGTESYGSLQRGGEDSRVAWKEAVRFFLLALAVVRCIGRCWQIIAD